MKITGEGLRSYPALLVWMRGHPEYRPTSAGMKNIRDTCSLFRKIFQKSPKIGKGAIILYGMTQVWFFMKEKGSQKGKGRKVESADV
ncbi:MAG: hypothetical protein LUQ25_06360, partial [Methanoregulaceae archaeon]|nr:hypothetical protein [Methanoregulaceae archaeon]